MSLVSLVMLNVYVSNELKLVFMFTFMNHCQIIMAIVSFDNI